MKILQTIALWVQAIAASALVLVTIWVVFYSDVGELTVKLLQSDLMETREQKSELEKQKKKAQGGESTITERAK